MAKLLGFPAAGNWHCQCHPTKKKTKQKSEAKTTAIATKTNARKTTIFSVVFSKNKYESIVLDLKLL